ncbi:MAG TPA: hypothetical protein GXX17_01875 [Clostridiales bacterium]|nr:hypothetical protein [Clostridiales bacterium]
MLIGPKGRISGLKLQGGITGQECEGSWRAVKTTVRGKGKIEGFVAVTAGRRRVLCSKRGRGCGADLFWGQQASGRKQQGMKRQQNCSCRT